VKRKQDIFLSLGSNIGDRKDYLLKAGELIAKRIGPIRRQSSIYETEPWGTKEIEWFLNQVIHLESRFLPREILKRSCEIENALGRIKSQQIHPTSYVSRPIDIDILFYGDEIIDTPELIIPHPLTAERRFVLVPMVEIAREFMHPVLNRTIGNLLLSCRDTGSVRIWNAD